MARNPNVNPSYLRHRASGKARVVVRDHTGARKQVLLPGPYKSKESLAEYGRVCALLRVNDGRLPAPKDALADLTVSELVLRFMEHAATYYREPVTQEPTGEIAVLTLAFRPLCRLYGPVPVQEFDSLKLEVLQTALATGSWMNAKELKKKKDEIGSLFHYNELVVLSDGTGARIGSFTEKPEWFKVWRTIEGEGEAAKSQPQKTRAPGKRQE